MSDLLNRGGRKVHRWSGFNWRHLLEGGFDTESSSYGSKLAEEL